MKRKVAACYLKKGMAYCLMGAMLLGLSIGTAGCGKEQKGTQEAEGNTEIQEVEGNDGPIEIVYWNQWTQEDETAFLKKYVEEYNSSQDKYHVSFLAIPYEEYTTTKLATAFATNEAPDIFECSPAIINQYLDAGVCEPLDDIITDEIRNDFTDAAFDRVSRDGKIYGIPLDSDLVALYYNKEILEQNDIISAGRSGSKWMENVCRDLDINTNSNRVDIGVRVELPAGIFAHLTDELYESKIVYRTSKYEDLVRTFCMNPKGEVVNENTNGIVTVNGHSYEDPAKQTNNTNFALLVAKHFSEPFKDSNGYGESIARLSNMLGGGVIVQRFGDLIKGRRSTEERIGESFTVPTLNAAAGDLSLVLPKRLLDGIIEMIYALDKIAPGTASDDTLLYGVEVKFYNMEVELDHNLMTRHEGLYIIGDGSGITHSLSHASASGVYVARQIISKM